MLLPGLAVYGAQVRGVRFTRGSPDPQGTAGERTAWQSAETAVDELNARGGIGGRRLALVVKDYGGDTRWAIEVATELRDGRLVAVIGHILSAVTLAAAGVSNDRHHGVVALSPTASSPQVMYAGPWAFRVSPSDLAYGPALAR